MTKQTRDLNENVARELASAIAIENTQFGALPNNVGYPRGMQGVTRKLTKREVQQQRNLQRP